MTKSTITRLWIGGLIVLTAGLVIGGISLGLMLANGGSYTPAVGGTGYDFTPHLDSYFWTTLGVTIAGFVIAAAGGVIQLVAWIGALVNTYPLLDKTWFVVLLVGGLVGFAFGLAGFAVMIAYVVAGPDGAQAIETRLPTTAPASQQKTLLPVG